MSCFISWSYGRWVDGDYESHGQFLLDSIQEEKRSAAIEKQAEIIRKQQHVWKIGRYDTGFVRQQLRKCLDVLSYSLGDGPWLFGEEPSTYDAGVFGILASFIHYPLPDPCVQISREYDNLVQYCDCIRETYYDLGVEG